ncbi:MAG: hypothetical protein K0Q79_217 [Flavipsychrobacter sp.]|nr:hypothetical protein [Flavipsychrobacter sp.]
MQHVPDTTIVDISHNVAQYDIQQAAYLLLSAYRHFQKGAIHVLLVDIFSGNSPKMLLAEKDGHYFIVPDNGLLPLAFDKNIERIRLCAEFEKPFLFSDWLNHAAKAIEKIIAGDLAWLVPYNEIKGGQHSMLNAHAHGIDCGIHYIDRYGNVVLNITQKQFDEMVRNRPFKIKVMRTDITTVSKNYNDVPEKVPLCRFNDAGFLEIALNRASAADLLGIGANNSGNLHYQTMRIFL